MNQNGPALAPLVTHLSRLIPLGDADRAAVLALPATLRTYEPAAYLVREGEAPIVCGVLLDGYAFRQKLTGDGARQIVSLHIPGEALDFQGLYLAVADHNLQTLTRATVANVPRDAIRHLLETRPMLARAITATMLVEASIAREWVLNVGRRDGRARVAHLLCEFAARLDAQGLGGTHGYELPMTQEQLGDAVGLTSVHVNRMLKDLEQLGLLDRHGRMLRFADWHALRDLADFNSRYLHLGLQDG